MKKKPVRVRRKNVLAPVWFLIAVLTVGSCISVFVVYRKRSFDILSEPEVTEPETVPRRGDVVEKTAVMEDTCLRED